MLDAAKRARLGNDPHALALSGPAGFRQRK
jgi:hypothetical protein